MHSLPTFYPFNNTFIINDIIIPGHYVGLDRVNYPALFFNDTYEKIFKTCGKHRYIIKINKSHPHFKCAADVIKDRTVKNCPTFNYLHDQPKFFTTGNGVFYSSPAPLQINFNCNGVPQEITTTTKVGKIEFPEACAFKFHDQIFYGGNDKNDVFYADDFLEMGNLTKFIGSPLTPNLKLKGPTFNQNRTYLLPKFSQETLDRYRQHLEITVAAGSLAIVFLALASIGGLWTIAVWYKASLRSKSPSMEYMPPHVDNLELLAS